MRELYASENGDTWFLLLVDGEPAVLHRPNTWSGGRETCCTVEAFLRRTPRGAPQRAALMRLVAPPT